MPALRGSVLAKMSITKKDTDHTKAGRFLVSFEYFVV